MKFILFLLLLLSLCAANIEAKNPVLLTRHCIFKNTDGTLYIETQLCILKASVNYVKQDNNSFKASYSVDILYQGAGNKLLKQTSYNFTSPEVKDTATGKADMIDIRRAELPEGYTSVTIILKDNYTNESIKQEEMVKLSFPAASIGFSTPVFVESYAPAEKQGYLTRLGYDIIPRPVNIFTESTVKLTFYSEIYNALTVLGEGMAVICYEVCDREGNALEEYTFVDPQKAMNTNFLFSSIDISHLPAGNYFLRVSVKNSKTETIAKHDEYFVLNHNYSYDNMGAIHIENTFSATVNKDSLFYWLRALRPIAGARENELIDSIDKKHDTLSAQKFMLVFWNLYAPGSEEVSWKQYKNVVAAVEYNFATPIRHGYETDRGRIFLQYGAPNQRDISNSEPGAFPYEVWKYNKLETGQAKVYFIFCNTELAANGYRLIHSNAEGEVRDPRWKYVIYKSFKESNGSLNFDNEEVKDHYGKRIDDIINE